MGRPGKSMRQSARAMTLIELIVVMGLLSIVLALSMPLLSRFARGRSLQEEARRMLALTQYGRNEAVSRGVPMELWIDSDNGAYGLSPAPGYDDQETKEPIEFTLGTGLTVEAETTATQKSAMLVILCQPDGSIEASSPSRLIIRDLEHDEAIGLEQIEGGLGYAMMEELEQEAAANVRTATSRRTR